MIDLPPEDRDRGMLVRGTLVLVLVALAIGAGSGTALAADISAEPAITPDPASPQARAAGPADLRVSITGNKATAVPGDEVVYTVTVTNVGPSAARRVGLVVRFPAGLRVIGASEVACKISVAARTVTCPPTSAPPRAETRFTMTAVVRAGARGTLRTSAALSSATPDLHPSTMRAAVVTRVASEVEVDMDLSASKYRVRPGARVYLTARVKNLNGRSAAYNTTVTFIADDVLLRSGKNCNQRSGEIVCRVGTIPSGRSIPKKIGVDVSIWAPSVFDVVAVVDGAHVDGDSDDVEIRVWRSGSRPVSDRTRILPQTGDPRVPGLLVAGLGFIVAGLVARGWARVV